MSSIETGAGGLLKAVWFASEKHRDQRRKGDDSPYINHPVGVAWILQHEAGVNDVATLQAALLHDTVEDTDTTFEELEEHFGAEVTGIVREVTDDKSLTKEQRKVGQIEHAGSASDKAKLVKLADKLYNYRDLKNVPPKGWGVARITGYFVWGSFVTRRCAGVSAALDALLEEFYQSSFEVEGAQHPVLPSGDLNAFLGSYLSDLKLAQD